MRVAVFGSTGTAGSEAVRQCLADPRVTEVRAVTRRPLDLRHDRLTEVRCADLARPESIGDALTGVDACFYCLGVSVRNMRDAATYREITVDYPLAAARVLLDRSPDHTFVFLSGQGTDPSGRSRMMWARVKGTAENELAALDLERLFCFRPGYIHPEAGHVPPGTLHAILAAAYPLLRVAAPATVVRASELGRAMIEAASGGRPGGVIGNREIRELAGQDPAGLGRTAS